MFLAAIPAAIGAAEGAAAGTAAVAAGTTTLALGATAAAGGVAAYGAYQQGQAQKNMMNYQAQAAAVQEQVVQNTAQANISGIQQQSAEQATILGRTQATQKGAQLAAAGAQGLDGSGTAADIAKDTFTKQQLDQMTLQYNANVQSWNTTNAANAQLWGLGAQESQYSLGAETSAEAGDIGAASTLLGSAAQVGTIGVISSGGNPGYMMR